MASPAWLTAIFAAASLAVAVYCAGRLVVARRGHRATELDTDGAHVIMGVAMAGMLVSSLRTLPSAIWEVVFAAAAVWFGYRMLQRRRGAQPRARAPLPRPPLRRDLQDHHGNHHGLHADPDALTA